MLSIYLFGCLIAFVLNFYIELKPLFFFSYKQLIFNSIVIGLSSWIGVGILGVFLYSIRK